MALFNSGGFRPAAGDSTCFCWVFVLFLGASRKSGVDFRNQHRAEHSIFGRLPNPFPRWLAVVFSVKPPWWARWYRYLYHLAHQGGLTLKTTASHRGKGLGSRPKMECSARCWFLKSTPDLRLAPKKRKKTHQKQVLPPAARRKQHELN